MKKFILCLIIMILSAAGVSAEDYSTYVLDEPVKLGGEVYETVNDFAAVERLTVQHIRHTSGDREIEEIIVSGTPPYLSPLRSELSQDGALGYELNRDPSMKTGTVRGNTDSYRIFCQIDTSLHFLFYKGRHVYSANSASVTERHRKYKVTTAGGGKLDRDTSDDTYTTVLQSEGFDSRIERAADIGYNTKKPEYSFIEEYAVHDDRGNYVCTMEVAHPEMRKMNILNVISLIGGLTGVTLMLISAFRRRKKT